MNYKKFKVGDCVIATGEYKDEQLGQFTCTEVQVVVAVKKVTEEGTSGQWIKTDVERDWIDSGWFKLAKKSI